MELYVDIKKKFPGFRLEVSFEIGADTVGFLGASGSGKSMTLRCIAGLDTPDTGIIVLNNRVLFDSKKGINLPSRIRNIGLLFQSYALFPHMTVEENIGFALSKLGREEKHAKITEMIELVKLRGLEKRYPHQLSGGQQQRVALSRALAIDPAVLLLDEPFSALDDHLRSQMLRQFDETLSHYPGITMFVTHNMEEAYRICTKLIVLSDGKKVADGRMEEVFKNPPSVEAARITGCKNICGAREVSPYETEALDWSVKLQVGERITSIIGGIGIRSQDIRLAKGEDMRNVLDCWPVFTSEAPFGMTVYLRIGKPVLGHEHYHLQWEVSKDMWRELMDKALPWRIQLPPEKLIVFGN
ncbi:MAG: sulfate/molybdate ABC transporter ATP-binding protein [Bacillota bacterium]